MFKQIIILIVTLVLSINAQKLQQIKFNTQVDCSAGCIFTSGSIWVGGVAPISPNQNAIIDLTTATTQNKQIFIITSQINFGALNVTSNQNTPVQVVVQSNLKTDSIQLIWAELDINAGNTVNLNSLTTQSSVFNNQGSLIVVSANLETSQVTIGQQLVIKGDIYLEYSSTLSTFGNITIDGGSLTLTSSAFNSNATSAASVKSSPIVSYFTKINADAQSTLTFANNYQVVIENSFIYGYLDVQGGNAFDVKNTIFERFNVQEGAWQYATSQVVLTTTSCTYSGISTQTPRDYETVVVFQGQDNQAYFAISENDLVFFVGDGSSLEVSGYLTFGGNDSSISLGVDSSFTANKFDISGAAFLTGGDSNANINLTNGQISSIMVILGANVTLDNVIVTGELASFGNNLNVNSSLQIQGSFYAYNGTNLNITTQGYLPTSPLQAVVTANQSTITFTDSIISFGVAPGNTWPAPVIKAKQPYYLLSSNFPFKLGNTQYIFSTPGLTNLKPTFQTTKPVRGQYYLTVTFN